MFILTINTTSANQKTQSDGQCARNTLQHAATHCTSELLDNVVLQ